ncbi:MAG: adenylate/guanylate cyclase domain-containing protein, partial [Hyphomonadaceae bacterium]
FSDLVGFSKLAKQLTPQETGAAVIALQTPVVRAISEHGGELDKLIGDGAMALWLSSGSDVPQHFANSAVAAAIAAVKGVRAVAKSAGWSGIDLRVGIHCGDVVVGDFGAEGRRTFTAIGPVVNTAARYEQVKDSAAAQFGQVRISPAVFARLTPAASSQFAAEPLKFEEKTPPSLLAHRLASPIGDDNGVE